MKLEITPETLSAHRLKDQPAVLTAAKIGLFFNKKAVNDLSIKIGHSFSLEFEDGNLYIKESASGFRVGSELKNSLLASAHGVGRFLDTLLRKGRTTYKFQIGEFKMGRRPLTLIEK